MKRLLRYVVSFVLAILIVMGIRMFCVGSYHISTNSMGDALQNGDFVLVNKIHSQNNPGYNRIILFKSPLQKDAEAPPLLLSRCVGMPGDTIQITYDGYYVNGQLLRNLSGQVNTFRIQKDIKESLLNVLQNLQIPYRDVAEDSLSLTIRLTSEEEMMIRDNLPQILKMELVPEHGSNYSFVIPMKGHSYHLDSINLILYQEAILKERGRGAVIRNGKMFLYGKEQSSFFFKEDYYWVLSDNEEAIDSRHLGLIPANLVVGNVWFCWYSKDKARLFKQIN